MKVCVFTSVHSALDPRIFYKQARTLVEAGYDVTLIARYHGNEVIDGVSIVALPKPRNRFQRMLWTTLIIFRLALRQKADIYHFHDPELLPWGCLLRRITRKPVIYDVHENYREVIHYKSWIPVLLRKPAAWIFDKIEGTLAARVSAIIVATDPMKQRFSDYHQLCVSIQNFPHLEIVRRSEEANQLLRRGGESWIIYTGGVTELRGFRTILDAMNIVVGQSADAVCIILGNQGDLGWLDPDHQLSMRRLIESRNLRIEGKVSYDEMLQYLNASTIGWNPVIPRQEGISTKSFEYMACGKPIVTSGASLTADIVRRAGCGILVDPYDPSEHASAILHLIENPKQAQIMGRNGLKAILEKYNWETEGKKLIELYNTVYK